MLTEAEIIQFIDDDSASQKKRQAKEGLRYYEGDHDIKDYKLYYYDAEGILKEDKTRSNIKISHPFFAELVDQAVQYMLSGKDGFVKSDVPELQTELDNYFNQNEDFTAELYDTLTGAVSKGFEYMYAYKNAENRLAFQNADSIGVVEVEAKHSSDGKNYLIYWYVERINRKGESVKRVQVWDDAQTYFYTQIDDGSLILDPPEENRPNPRPNVIYKKDNDDNTYYEGFGFIPFFRLDNCRKQYSDLKSIKKIIDDYDLHACSLSNNLVDFDTPIYAVRGFQGDNLDELIQNVKVKKHIGLDGDGGIDVQTVDIPYAARQTKLELDERSIYRFGMGVSLESLKDTNATTNVAIKSAYALLDLKCNKLEIRLKQFLRKIIKIVLAEINGTNGTDYQQKDVYFDFQREMSTNVVENAQVDLINAQRKQAEVNTIMNVAAAVGDEQTLKAICDVMEWDYEEIQGQVKKAQEEALTGARAALENVVPEDDGAPDEPVTPETIPGSEEMA